MARVDILKLMYTKNRSPLEFHFDSLYMPSMYNYLTPEDIMSLYNIASSVKLNSKIEYKYKEIDRIMTNRGFKRFHSGTNRIVYSYLEDQSFLVKIAIDRVGLKDNPDEYRNQFLLKPFVTKIFEVSPCGTVATVERVEPIVSRQEYAAIAGDVFDLLYNMVGQYILEDVGSNYFMNIGIRRNFGVVLLDFPYVFPLDGNKLYCNKPIIELGDICGGIIDYDIGFNNLICTKCGKKYLATELQKYKDDKQIIFMKGESGNMKISIRRGNEIVRKCYDGQEQSDTIKSRDQYKREFEQKKNYTNDTRSKYNNREIKGRDERPNNSNRSNNYDNRTSKSDNRNNRSNDAIVTTNSRFIAPPLEKEIKINELVNNKPIKTNEEVLTDKEVLEKYNLSDADFEEPSEEETVDDKSNQKVEPISEKDMSDY